MDITFSTPDGRFNYRACAVFLHDGHLLAMHDERSPYYYLPGGRVAVNETAEDAVLREVREELGFAAQIDRALWLNQSFFTEDVSGERYHELCLYFLMGGDLSPLLSQGRTFVRNEGRHTHSFEWLPVDRLRDLYLYPTFIKEGIFSLPDTLQLRTERE